MSEDIGRTERNSSVARLLVLQGLLLVPTLAAIDFAAYWLMPDNAAVNFPTYREGYYVPDFFGRGYPKDYYEANAERGFDIKPTDTPRTDQIHVLDDVDVSYNIWSNRYGCFDAPHNHPMQAPYYYFAGDSITWGYSPYETKFATVFEQITGIETFKCGVTHSGQRHEFSKFLDVVSQAGKMPDKVVVVYSPTDVANDYLYPHSTVIDGGLVDMKRLDGQNRTVQLGQDWFDMLHARKEEGRHLAEGDSFSLSKWLMQYSISSQFLNAGLFAMRNHFPAIAANVPVLGEEPLLHWADKYEFFHSQKLYDLHRLVYQETLGGTYRYTNYPEAEPNKEVLREWRAHAAANNYKLVLMLLPIAPIVGAEVEMIASSPYSELKDFLNQNKISFLDLSEELTKAGIDPASVFWESESHFSIDGNIQVGELLAKLL
jgi:hypothetical protein